MKYKALIAYDRSEYANVEFHAKNDEAAKKVAAQMARDCEGDFNYGDEVTGHRVVSLEAQELRLVAEDIEA